MAGDVQDEDRSGGAETGPDPDREREASEGFSDADIQDIEDRSRLRSPVIYEVLRREGEEELERPTLSLWWSGVAAGLSISLSLLSQAVLRHSLPDAPWRELVSSLGYTVGFLVAVMARHQLFTENTITPVLPVAAAPSWRNVGRLSRLWGVVLVANFVGTFAAALFYSYTPVVSPDLKGVTLEVSAHAMAHPPWEMFVRAVGAGFIIAAMVWLLPSAEGSQFQVIVLMTYLIAAAELAHIVAGSLEAFMLVLDGRMDVGALVLGFAGPTLAGNVVGGTALFALLSYGQVAQEL